MWFSKRFLNDYIRHIYYKFKYFRSNWKRRRRAKQFPIGSIVEDCNYHPVLVVDNDGYDDITTLSLLNPIGLGSCSISHCGIILLSVEEIQAKMLAYKLEGNKGLNKLMGWTEEQFAEFEKNWRSSEDYIYMIQTPDYNYVDTQFSSIDAAIIYAQHNSQKNYKIWRGYNPRFVPSELVYVKET